jgi:alpha-L-rhamnosidase
MTEDLFDLSRYPWRDAYPQAGVETPLARRRVEPVALSSPGASRFPAPLGGDIEEIMLDFGKEFVGDVSLNVSCPGSAELDVVYGEYEDEARLVHPSPLTWYRDPRDLFKLEAGEHTLRSPGRRAFRYIRLSATSGLTVRSVHLDAEGYPVQERGKFECNDELINRIWEISCHTTRLCMQHWYEDGIKRDGCLWIGDYRVQYLCNVTAFGDMGLARKSLFIMAAGQREDGALPACAAIGGANPCPHRIDYMPGCPEGCWHWVLFNYCTDYVSTVYEYWWHTGDLDTVKKLWPCLQRLLRYLREDVDPQQAKPLEHFLTDNSDLNDTMGGGYHSHAGLHMGFCEAFRDAARLARALGENGPAESLQETYAAEVSRVRRAAWDDKREVFVDGDRVSWRANAQSVLAGVTPAGAPARELLERVSAIPDAIRPVAGIARFHTLRGLFEAGLGEMAIDWIRRDWGRVVEAGMTTCPEGIPENMDDVFHHEPTRGQGGENDQRMWSLCHGWSAGPAYLLPAFVLGARPTSPGYASHSSDPQLGDLAWAEGTVPTPRGELVISRRS